MTFTIKFSKCFSIRVAGEIQTNARSARHFSSHMSGRIMLWSKIFMLMDTKSLLTPFRKSMSSIQILTTSSACHHQHHHCFFERFLSLLSHSKTNFDLISIFFSHRNLNAFLSKSSVITLIHRRGQLRS